MRLSSKLKKVGRSVKRVARKLVDFAVKKMSYPPGRSVPRGAPHSSRGARGGNPRGRGGFPQQRQDLTSAFGNISLGPETEDGRSLHVVTNHFEFKWTGEEGEFTIHQYHLRFTPPDLPIRIRKSIIRTISDMFNGAYLYDNGEQLFCCNKFQEDGLEVVTPFPGAPEGTECKLLVTYTKSLPKDSPFYLQIYNLIVRKCLFGMGLDEIGQHFYETKAFIKFQNLNLELWPGYDTSISIAKKGLLLCVDVTHKVVRDVKLLAIINELKNKHGQFRSNVSLEDYILKEIKGCNVLARYNKISYRVEGIRLDLNPLSTFTIKDKEVSFREYYKLRHGIEVKDLEQPLIISTIKAQKGPKGKREVREVILLPELCQMTGLTEEMRANMGIMRDLSKHLHMDPSSRVKMLEDFVLRMVNSDECRRVLNSWGFVLENKLAPCSIGRVLPSQNIVFANENVFQANDKSDWTRALRTNKMLVCIPLKRWILVTGERDYQKALEFVQTMQQVATPLGFQIDKPMLIEKFADVRVASYMRSLQKMLPDAANKKVQLVLCVLPNNNSDLYGNIKKLLSHDLGIVSQCILSKNLSSKNTMSIATKLVIQMNTKLGGEPWTVAIPSDFSNCVTIGFDTYGKTGALVSTANRDFSRYFSYVFNTGDRDQMNSTFKREIPRCLEVYMKTEGKLPTTIVFYRNSVEEGKIKRGDVHDDATQMQRWIQDWLVKLESHIPKEGINLVYIVMCRKSLTRLMAHTATCENGVGARQVTNPPPGTVLDDGIIDKHGPYKEFYIVPTTARQGTVRALQYKVILDTKGSPPAVLEAFTYKLCHLYYNWSGTVNLPSVCQYAGKLAKQTVQAMPNSQPSEEISGVLHFL